MKLNEILNRKVQYKVTVENENAFQTKATINGRIIDFACIKRDSGLRKTEWRCTFLEAKDENDLGNYDATGSGGEFEVFSMVKDSLLEFIDKYRPDQIYFNAKQDGGKNKQARIRVYDALLKKFKAPGYTFKRVDGVHDGSTLFVIEKEEDDD